MVTKGYQGTRVNLKAKLSDLDEPFITRSDDGSATSVYGHPIRGLYPSEDVFFKGRPEVAGMASEDGAIILNPYSQIPEDNYMYVAKLEAARHYMNNMGDSFPKFELTPAQLKYFRDDIKYDGGEQKWKETLLSRILVGDPTAGKITEEQDRAARQVIEGMRKSRSTRQDSKGGRQQPAYRWEDGDGKPEKLPEGKTNQWGGTLRNEGRKPYLHRNSDGKITHYGTTRSTVVKDGGAFYVVPTLFNGEDIMDAKVGPDGKVIRTARDKNDFDEMDRRALQRMKDTGEYWAKFDNVDDARDFASGRGKFANDGPHATQQAEMQKEWNKFILRNWDQMSDEYRNDADLSRAREEWESGRDVFGDGSTRRQDSKGGDAVRADLDGGDTGSETAVSDTVVTEQPAPQEGGPRIVVNPKVFSDKRDALCVAMNEAFRILMEVNGFEPQAEPTPAQRRFFADTAYANDELMLRRTILARICTFDTSIS